PRLARKAVAEAEHAVRLAADLLPEAWLGLARIYANAGRYEDVAALNRRLADEPWADWRSITVLEDAALHDKAAGRLMERLGPIGADRLGGRAAEARVLESINVARETVEANAAVASETAPVPPL